MTRRDERRLLMSATLSLIIVGTISWHIVSSRTSTRAHAERASLVRNVSTSPGALGGGRLRARAIDPAGAPMEWVREGFELEPPIRAPSLHEQIQSEEQFEAWMGLLEWSLPLGQGGEAGRQMAQCAARFEPDLDEKCSWEITAVLRRVDEETGRIAYARADVTEGGHQPVCRAFASCSSKAWAHRDFAPMPEHLDDELVFSQVGRGSFWHAGSGTKAAGDYRRRAASVERSRDELDAVARQPTDVATGSLAWNLIFFQHRVDEFQCMVDVIEGREGACGA